MTLFKRRASPRYTTRNSEKWPPPRSMNPPSRYDAHAALAPRVCSVARRRRRRFPEDLSAVRVFADGISPSLGFFFLFFFSSRRTSRTTSTPTRTTTMRRRETVGHDQDIISHEIVDGREGREREPRKGERERVGETRNPFPRPQGLGHRRTLGSGRGKGFVWWSWPGLARSERDVLGGRPSASGQTRTSPSSLGPLVKPNARARSLFL